MAVKLHLNNLTSSMFNKFRQEIVCNPPQLTVTSEPDDPSLNTAMEAVAKVIRTKISEVKRLREEVPLQLEQKYLQNAKVADDRVMRMIDGDGNETTPAPGSGSGLKSEVVESKDVIIGSFTKEGGMNDKESNQEDEEGGEGGQGLARLGISEDGLNRLVAVRSQVDRTARELLDVLPRYTGGTQLTVAELRKQR